ncbi:single-stranded-DNA-specific exonuclease RecJ [Clostridium botulinum]|uniref:Single-stranded-DNA-specific exonuclease RecJ n=1 Tax=Clostridium botulinum (strain Hall / ATCC 3502 / NCTC 13319 / Type A) TaxID=441771 RepID=A5I5J8_CLOBH|nr:single-stranded-DNA-specific exonuclease RecJ [Clostridium botulinum]ABS32359.1 single-stranded-DNA-specific exonuclease RecJ [Clostridium botulinum A str. ATCC 19397]ABS37937.1 single-stranded-DNA-specific exonuclease RecJ [Clostridium botulinum A str. Hall]AWB18552.1 single-stranded-DNA-specific exonuclease RecJ [Clostridium botulinum]AWB31325.1 single-stranded-DNA-specific exonuclease RecJ [Clostridium botulinum]EGT5616696.1 single-stranded-DNA-specific exonuclease RecJ [Clostridium botu
MNKKWMLRRNKLNIRDIANKSGISETLCTVLVNREIYNLEDIKDFLEPSLEKLYNPLLMKDMDKGTEIIKRSIIDKKKIAIYGDYDADGVTSTVILYIALKECEANVIYYIPDRETEGYGMCTERVERLKAEGVEVIITCDNGIAALEQVERAKELGMTVVITDHHELPFIENEKEEREYVVPKADAIINPKQKDCYYPFKMLCGAGIAFKFSKLLYEKLNMNPNKYKELLQFAAIGTICDVVDLKGENRIIAKLGLESINNTNNLGLRALIKETSLNEKNITSYNVGFIIGPCINATGRLDTAALSVELFLAKDIKRAEKLAKELRNLNTERQEITMVGVEEITYAIENSSLKNDKVLVIYKENIHESIAGIVSGRIKDAYNRPTIVLTKGKEMPKGSGRSIDGYNLFEELMKCKEYIYKFGGHPMAAGLTIEEKNINKLREELNKNCNLKDEDFIPKIRIDKRLALKEVNLELIDSLQCLEPFGKGNSSPILAEKNIKIEGIRILGKDQNTLKLTCRVEDTNKRIHAIAFGKVDEFKRDLENIYEDENVENIITNPLMAGLKLDLIYYPMINEYNGNVYTQLRIIDYRINR